MNRLILMEWAIFFVVTVVVVLLVVVVVAVAVVVVAVAVVVEFDVVIGDRVDTELD